NTQWGRSVLTYLLHIEQCERANISSKIASLTHGIPAPWFALTSIRIITGTPPDAFLEINDTMIWSTL
ncbi:hypothetical protein, partial [Vibrio splendidus]|uniref:hypothetical protein n=1 Tax=Vibrio splendidus TaxID=29497 RepID=UPI001A7E1AAF